VKVTPKGPTVTNYLSPKPGNVQKEERSIKPNLEMENKMGHSSVLENLLKGDRNPPAPIVPIGPTPQYKRVKLYPPQPCGSNSLDKQNKNKVVKKRG